VLPVRPLIAICILALLAASANADVIVLKDHDTPLCGEILRETEGSVRFRHAGLPEGSFVEISRDRIRSSWKEPGRREPSASPEPDLGLPRRTAAVPPRLREAAPPRGAGSRADPRSPEEIRQGLLRRVRERLNRLAPDSPVTGCFTLFGLLVLGTALLWVGGRVADMEDLGWTPCMVLSLLTTVLLVLDLYTYPDLSRSAAFAVALVAQVVCWVLFVRLFLHEPIRKAVLLLAILLLGVSLLVALGLAVLCVI
jgi:hypothetical protein